RELVRFDSRSWNNRLGSLRSNRLLSRGAPAPARRKRRSKYDHGHGGGLLCALEYLGDSGEWGWRLFTPSIWTERRDHRFLETDNGRYFLPGWMARSSLDPVPSRLSKFSTVRKHLCRRKHPGGDVPDGTGSIMASPHSLLLFGNTCR